MDAAARAAERRRLLQGEGLAAFDPMDGAALSQVVGAADGVIVTAAPGSEGCPVLALTRGLLADGRARRIVYVSTTGVYGDRGGRWVLEEGSLNAPTIQGARRAAAERGWLALGQAAGAEVMIARLPAIYGPGRSVLDRLRAGDAQRVRKPGQVFNRVHVDDAAEGLILMLERGQAGQAYNLTDDAPAPAHEVTEWAALRLSMEPPPWTELDDPAVNAEMRRFYLDSKRIGNGKAKAALGWRPRYPSYREGLEAILAQT